ncbi:MAG: hypothetical protein DLM53_02995 [Candidatus Eremiobacter antarcticus]|nr:YqzL family protein [Candidatus Eremiobacteraeota bacterium]MBC5808379.1 YqzL family protein [Candidatus Eremiobacteraeota bacterium]PZR63847.1 MAG: hypothetical protein DLM53_02995 [Candidatus Eremiobacter sp. RRmetagenome_bin22]
MGPGRTRKQARFENARRSVTLLLSPELFWKLFLTTGSVKAYLLYKRMAPQDSR